MYFSWENVSLLSLLASAMPTMSLDAECKLYAAGYSNFTQINLFPPYFVLEP